MSIVLNKKHIYIYIYEIPYILKRKIVNNSNNEEEKDAKK